MKKVFLAIAFVFGLGLVGCENDNINDQIEIAINKDDVTPPGEKG